MLRTAFVIGVLILFALNALRGPFEALLLYLWIAYFRPDAFVWDASVLTAIKISFIAGVYLIVRSLPSLGKAPFDLRGLLLLVFFLISLTSSWTSPVRESVWDYWVDFAQTAAVSYVIYVLASQNYERMRTTMLAIAFSLGFEAAKQGYYGLIVNPGGTNENRLPQLGDNNGVAVGMLMLATLFIGLSRTATGKWATWEKRLHMVFLVGVLYRSITTYSRGGFLALAAMTSVYVLRSNQKLKATIGAVLIASVLLPTLPPQFWNRMRTMTVATEERLDDSSAGRIHFWRVAILMAKDHPLLGVGLNGYQAMYNDYDFSAGYYGVYRSVHSMWFGVMADLGYPALVLFILMFVMAIKGMAAVMKLAKSGAVPIEYYHLAVALQTGCVACIVGGTFLPWMYVDMLWHYIAMTMVEAVAQMRWTA
jgi:putative inorganic carbon (HCO3(-)) transporter